MSKVRVFIIAKGIYILRTHINYHKRPYHIESTPSRPIWEVKQCRARLVRWWETTLEVLVSLLTFLRRTGCIGKTHHLSIILLRQKLVKCSFLFYFFPPRQKLVKCFHFCLHRSGYSLVRPFVPPSFLCPPFISSSLVFTHTRTRFSLHNSLPCLRLSCTHPCHLIPCRVFVFFLVCLDPPHTPFRVSVLSDLLRSPLLSFFPPSPPSSSLFPLPPVLLLLSLYKAESHSLLPMSLAFSSPCFHCRCIVGEPRPPVFLPPCLSWSPSFVDFPFLIRTPFFLSVCMFWCVLPLVVWRRWRRKAPKEGKGTGTLKVRVPRRTGGEGVERGRKGGLF